MTIGKADSFKVRQCSSLSVRILKYLGDTFIPELTNLEQTISVADASSMYILERFEERDNSKELSPHFLSG